MELLRARAGGRPWRSTLLIPPSTWSFIPTSRFVRSRRRRKSSAGGHLDRKAEELLHRIKGALTPEEADAAGKAFRAWSEAEGLLLVPRDDDERA
jgi:hypothetical protein